MSQFVSTVDNYEVKVDNVPAPKHTGGMDYSLLMGRYPLLQTHVPVCKITSQLPPIYEVTNLSYMEKQNYSRLSDCLIFHHPYGWHSHLGKPGYLMLSEYSDVYTITVDSNILWIVMDSVICLVRYDNNLYLGRNVNDTLLLIQCHCDNIDDVWIRCQRLANLARL